jgi:hypothetical protein
MRKYLNTLLEEKGISQERVLEVTGSEWGTNFMPISVVVDFLSNLDTNTQKKVKDTFVKIDFHNGDIVDFLKYIAKGIAI